MELVTMMMWMKKKMGRRAYTEMRFLHMRREMPCVRRVSSSSLDGDCGEHGDARGDGEASLGDSVGCTDLCRRVSSGIMANIRCQMRRCAREDQLYFARLVRRGVLGGNRRRFNGVWCNVNFTFQLLSLFCDLKTCGKIMFISMRIKEKSIDLRNL